MHLTVSCRWRSAGDIELRDGDLVVPPLPDEPGVYQWVFRHGGRERRYVGEADRLRRRFYGYRHPGPSQTTNLRMSERAIRVLQAGGSIELLVASDVTFVRDGQPHPADLTSKHARCFVENAALIDVVETCGELINDRGYGTLRDDPILR